MGSLSALRVCPDISVFSIPSPSLHASLTILLPFKLWWCTLKPTQSAGSWASRTGSTSWTAVPGSRSTLRLKKWCCIGSYTLCAPLLPSSSMWVTYMCSCCPDQKQHITIEHIVIYCCMLCLASKQYLVVLFHVFVLNSFQMGLK